MQSVWVTAIVEANKTRFARRHSFQSLSNESHWRASKSQQWRSSCRTRARQWHSVLGWVRKQQAEPSRAFCSLHTTLLPSCLIHFERATFFFQHALNEIWLLAQGDGKQTSGLVVLLRVRAGTHPRPLFYPKGPLLGAAGSRRLALFGFSTATDITFKGPFLVSQQIKVILQ